jgi:type I restriction enzyme S subunit
MKGGGKTDSRRLVKSRTGRPGTPLRARHYKPYPAYKDSSVEWLGEIPEGWEVKRLKFASLVEAGQSPPSEFVTEGIEGFPFLQGNAEFGPLNPDPRQVCTIATKRALPGDILLSVRAPVGDVNIADQAYAIGRGLCAIRFINNAESHFQYYLLVRTRFLLNSVATGSTYDGVTVSDVANLPALLPPIPEQRAIAAFLDRETAKIDALMGKNERLIELLQENSAALITHVVTKGLDPGVAMKDSGVEWLGEIPAHWDVSPLYARYEVALGKMLDTKRIVGVSSGRYLRNVDVQWDSINTEGLPEMDFAPWERDRYGLKAGDLLICEGGEVGRTAIWHAEIEQCFYQKAIHRVRPRSEQESPRFLYYLMYALAKGGVFSASGNPNTIDHLTAVQLKQFRFPFARLQEQLAIAAFLDRETAKLDALIAKVREAINRLKELRTALISAAVTGKIDVREEVP